MQDPTPGDSSRRRFIGALAALFGIGTVATLIRNLGRRGGPTPSTNAAPPLAQETTTTSMSTTTSTTQPPDPTTTSGVTTTSTEPSTTTTTLPPLLLRVIEREAWGATAAGDGFEPHTVERITVHHTAARLGSNSRAPALVRQHQRWHQDHHGWPDLAYHFIVDQAGNIYEGRPLEFRGDTGTNYDPTGHFLPCLEGDYREEEPTEIQVETLAGLCAWAAVRFGVGSDTLGGHLDYASTSCPGDNVYALISGGELAERIDQLLQTTIPEVAYLRGQEAVDLVALIEGG